MITMSYFVLQERAIKILKVDALFVKKKQIRTVHRNVNTYVD